MRFDASEDNVVVSPGGEVDSAISDTGEPERHSHDHAREAIEELI